MPADSACGQYAQAAALGNGQRRGGCNQRVVQRPHTVFRAAPCHQDQSPRPNSRSGVPAFFRPEQAACRQLPCGRSHTAPLPETNRAYRWVTSIVYMVLTVTARHAKYRVAATNPTIIPLMRPRQKNAAVHRPMSIVSDGLNRGGELIKTMESRKFRISLSWN